MSFQMVIELPNQQGTQAVMHALEAYKTRLRASVERTKRRLTGFEQRHGVTTARFLTSMTAEDLPSGDLEYVEWAGEAKMLKGIEAELQELEHAEHKHDPAGVIASNAPTLVQVIDEILRG